MSYVDKSTILPWNEASVKQAPDATGVYVLRNNSQVIIYVGRNREPRRLRERILEHFQKNDVPGVAYFDWYQTANGASAQALEDAWIKKYQPLWNIQLTSG